MYSSTHEPHFMPLDSYVFLENRLIQIHVFCLAASVNLYPCSPRLSYDLYEIWHKMSAHNATDRL